MNKQVMRNLQCSSLGQSKSIPRLNEQEIIRTSNIQTHLLNKSIQENNTNFGQPAMQAIVISFVIIIFNAIRIECKLEKKRREEMP